MSPSRAAQKCTVLFMSVSTTDVGDSVISLVWKKAPPSCQNPLINYLGMDVEQEPPEEKQNNSERKSFYYPIF